MNLGKKLQRMRQGRGLTAVELAKRSRVTTGFISQLEHSRTVPSLQTLQRIAAVLNVPLPYFLLDQDLPPQVVRKQERHIISLGQDGLSVSLLSPLPPQYLELALLELPCGAVSWSTVRLQAGQQCHLVLQGTICADYGDNTYRLEEGDSILWDGTLPYRLKNIGHDDARLLIAMAPAPLLKHTGEEMGNGTAMFVQADSLPA